MAQVRVLRTHGDPVVVNHQFGTVKRQLAAAELRVADEDGKVEVFAHFNTDNGRVGINPRHVVDYTEIKNAGE